MTASAALALLVALFVASSVCAQTAGDSTPAVLCRDAAQTPEVNALRAALAAEHRSHDLRLKLVEALLSKGCYAQAVEVLEEGERLHPRSGAIHSRLRYVQSMLSEERYFDGLARAELAAKTERNLLRCRKLRDISACDELLLESPKQPEVLIAKADALLEANRPADALPVYKHAAAVNPAAPSLDAKIEAAESRRQLLLLECEQGDGHPALQACALALLRGTHDEFNIHKRTGILLQGMGEPSRALDSYIAAAHLNSTDDAVSLAIVALTDSTGRIDAASLAARGNALLTLQRPNDAAVAFRQAQSLYPTLPGIDASLAAAVSQAIAERPKEVAVPSSQEATRVVDAGERRSEGIATAAESSREVVVAQSGAVPEASDALRSAPTFSNDAPASRSH